LIKYKFTSKLIGCRDSEMGVLSGEGKAAFRNNVPLQNLPNPPETRSSLGPASSVV
jgi:hypothetical protein